MSLSTPPAAAKRSVDRVWDALDAGGFNPGRRRGDTFTALCPVHGDTRPSLSIKYDRSREATLMHCFTCDADIHALTAAIGLTVPDTFDRPLEQAERKSTRPKGPTFKRHKLPPRIVHPPTPDLDGAHWERITTYPYADATGRVVEEVIREQTVIDGVTHKRFTQRFRSTSGGWVKRKPADFAPVLYHHPDVVAAIAAGRPVWLVEGEKDADNAIAAGVIATTNAQGAGSFPPELATVFSGASVNLVVDRDGAGYERGTTVGDLLVHHGAAAVRIFRPLVDTEKADLTDHLEAGHTFDQLEEISSIDAGVLARLGKARKALQGIESCRGEAQAHLAALAAGDAEIHQEHARTWADESEIRFRQLVDDTAGPSLFADEYGVAGKAGDAEIHAVVNEAAVVVAEIHKLVGRSAPTSVAEHLRKHAGTAEVIGLGAGGGEPPKFNGHEFIPNDDPKNPNVGVEYLVRNGETVQVKLERDGDTYRKRYHRILRGWAEVNDLAYEDNGVEASSTRPTHEVTVTFYRWIRDATGKPILEEAEPQVESAVVVWDADQLRDGSWAQALPWPNMIESTSRRGKDAAWDAIFNARPAPSKRTVVYTASGWRETDAGWFFVHAGGAIAKGGSLEGINSRLGSPFAPFTLQDPSDDPSELRKAWQLGTAPLRDQFPARVIAPLLGVVWESVFERVPFITHLVGGRAAYKTSTARLACQYFAPELHFRGRREILSGSNQGGTTIGLIRSLGTLNHLPVLVDDVAPDGNAKRAQTKLSELARQVYNETGRVTGKQRGGVNADTPTKATVITTGELSVTGSAQTRMLVIPLDPGALERGSEIFAELERAELRAARGLLGSSLIRWIAQDRTGLLAEYAAEAENAKSAAAALVRWRERLSKLPHDIGLKDRLTEAAIAAEHGINIMLRMLREFRAITLEEARDFHKWAEAGIYEAIALQDSAAGDPAEQLLGYVREALSSGVAHLTTDDGSLPANPSAHGWAMKGSGEYASYQASGQRIGIIKGEGIEARVYLIPSVTIGAANQVAQRADETFAETSVSISSALAARGWLEVDKSGKRAVGRRIDGALIRVWDIPLLVLDGKDDDEAPSGDHRPPAPPSNPSLFDGLPSNDPDQPAPESPETPAQSAPRAPVAAATTTAPLGHTAAPAVISSRRPKADAASPFRASAAVLHTDGIWLPGNEHLELNEPIRHLGDVARLITNLHLGTKNGWKTEDGQLLVTTEAAMQLGIPVDQLTSAFEMTKRLQELTRDHPLITDAIAAGYQVGGTVRALNTTTRVWNTADEKVRGRLVLLPTLKDDFKHILEDDPTPATIATRLQRFADALHAPYAISASSTGLDLMFSLAPSKEKRALYFAPSDPVPPAEIATLEADIDWQRKPTEEEAAHEWVHAYDRGGSYLAGVSGLELGIGAPTFHDGSHEIVFNKTTPGYWQVAMPEKAEWLTPNPIDPRNRDEDIAGRVTWLSTPTLDVARSLGYEHLEILQAYTWDVHTRLLESWYERIRDARTALDTTDVDDQRARDLLKEVYVRSLGLTASFEHHKGRPGFAPERYHFIQARARANILRRVHKIGDETGRWPVAISKDTILYTSDEPNPVQAWPGQQQNFGRGLGQYKYEGSARLDEHRQFLTGIGRYEGKSSLEFIEGI